jgi:hypothetical protein
MTDTTSITGLVQSTGINLAAGPRVRFENADQGDTQRPAERPGLSGGPKRPISGTGNSLLNGSNQIAAQQAANASHGPGEENHSEGETGVDGEEGGSSSGFDPANPQNLTEDEQKKVQELQQRDREVRAHEQAHKAAGGALAGSPTFKTVRGPDGKSYAVSGEVKIDTSAVPNNPEATIRKLEQVKRAALAPSNPSSQDRQVAAEAEAKIQQARQEIREEKAEELKEANGNAAGPTDSLSPADQSASRGPFDDSGFNGSRARPDSGALSPGSLLNLVA